MYKYTEIRKIGAGSFGAAILCKNNTTGEKVVMKRIDVRGMTEEERKTAKKEATILSNLNHPYIIKQYETFEDNGHLCLVMEYAEKGDLNAKLEERKGQGMPLEQALEYFTQLCLSLLYVHRKKILHRDLKLANVFVCADNTIRLGDFGIARVLKHTMEAARTVVGTPYYLSPEICANQPYNHKSDVWSLGCILYELLMGKHAFEASSINGLVRKIMKGQYEELPRPTFSYELNGFVRAMLQIKPSYRPSVQQILQSSHLMPYVKQLTAQMATRGIIIPYIELTGPNVPALPMPASGAALERPQGLPPLPGTAAVAAGGAAKRPVVAPIPKFGAPAAGAARGPGQYLPAGAGMVAPAGAADPNPLPKEAEERYKAKGAFNYHAALAAAQDQAAGKAMPIRATPAALPPNADWKPPAGAGYAPVAAAQAGRAAYGQPGAAGEAWPKLAGQPVPNPFQVPEKKEWRNPFEVQASAAMKVMTTGVAKQLGAEGPMREARAREKARIAAEEEAKAAAEAWAAAQAKAAVEAQAKAKAAAEAQARQFVYNGRPYTPGQVPGATPASPLAGNPSFRPSSGRGGQPDPRWQAPEPRQDARVSRGSDGGRPRAQSDNGPQMAPPQPPPPLGRPRASSGTGNDVPAPAHGAAANIYHAAGPTMPRGMAQAKPAVPAPLVASPPPAARPVPGPMPVPQSPGEINLAMGDGIAAEGTDEDALVDDDIVRTVDLGPEEPEFADGAESDHELEVDRTIQQPRPAAPARPASAAPAVQPARPGTTQEDERSAEELLAAADAMLPHGMPLQAYKQAAVSTNSSGGEARECHQLQVADKDPVPGSSSASTGDNVPSHKGMAGKNTPKSPQMPGLPSGESTAASNEPGDGVWAGAKAGKFMLNGHTLNPKQASPQDSVTYRLECLRTYLTELLGEEPFVKLYRSTTKAVSAARKTDKGTDLSKTVSKAVSSEHKKLLPLVFQLIYCEEQAYGQH